MVSNPGRPCAMRLSVVPGRVFGLRAMKEDPQFMVDHEAREITVIIARYENIQLSSHSEDKNQNSYGNLTRVTFYPVMCVMRLPRMSVIRILLLTTITRAKQQFAREPSNEVGSMFELF